MALEENLALLAAAREFDVFRQAYGDDMRYVVQFKNNDMSSNPLSATLVDGEWRYMLGGIYDSGCDWADIDVGKLEKLMAFCTMLGN